MLRAIRVVGVGGSTRPGSTSEQIVGEVLAEAELLGAEVRLIGGVELMLPLYDPSRHTGTPGSRRLLAELAAADGIVLASPAYHGSMSGLLKNALDYVEELRDDERPYFSGRSVGCVSVAQGWQGAVSTLAALREVTHALRGWPTPLGVAVNTAEDGFGPAGFRANPHVRNRLRTMTEQVVDFARMTALAEAKTAARAPAW